MILDTLTRKQTIELFYGYKDQKGNSLIKSGAFQELINIAKPDETSDRLTYLFQRLAILNGYNPDRIMKSGKSSNEIAGIRNIICYVLYHTASLNLTLMRLGELINRDHTTIKHGIANVESEISIYRHIRLKVEHVKDQLEQLLLEPERKTA